MWKCNCKMNFELACPILHFCILPPGSSKLLIILHFSENRLENSEDYLLPLQNKFNPRILFTMYKKFMNTLCNRMVLQTVILLKGLSSNMEQYYLSHIHLDTNLGTRVLLI